MYASSSVQRITYILNVLLTQILFIGPASREDRGFMYSYDVVLDSYMAHEDFNSGWFKMGGRMVRSILPHSFSAQED